MGLQFVFSAFAVASCFASATFAQTAPRQAPAGDAATGSVLTEVSQSRYVVTSEDARIVEERVAENRTPSTAGGTAALAAGGPLWSRVDAGQMWIGRVVALGNHGTQIFTEYDTAADRSELLSGFDQNPVSPVWSVPQPTASMNATVAAAEDAAVFVAMRQVTVSGGLSGPRTVHVAKHTSNAATPDWTYVFPITTEGMSKVMMDSTGTRIVAVVQNSPLGRVEIAVFDANGNGTPLSYTNLPTGPQVRTIQLSRDGSTLYVASPAIGYVWRVATQSTVSLLPLLSSLESQAISGDGSVIAIGGFNKIDIYERQSSGLYIPTYLYLFGGTAVCGRIHVSADSSRIIWGINYYDQNQRVRIEAFDVASKTVTMSHEVAGAGSYQNIVSDIAASRTGERFVVGLWGDQANLAPELLVYAFDRNLPVASFNYPGSIFDVDMDAAGKRYAVAAKAVHANLFDVGGRIDLYAYQIEDLVAVGSPQLGQAVEIQYTGVPLSPARMLIATALAKTPLDIVGVGSLALNRNTMWSQPMPRANAQGSTRMFLNVPSNPVSVGRSYYVQGLSTFPRRLSKTTLQLTVLP